MQMLQQQEKRIHLSLLPSQMCTVSMVLRKTSLESWVIRKDYFNIYRFDGIVKSN